MNWFINKINKFHKEKKLNNRGSAIVIVIIAMAMIGILASTILWTTYINYMIKLNDKQTKDNFYSAEYVIEQIMAGMKNEASYAAARGYKQVVYKWNEDVFESNRQNTFNNTYRSAIVYDFIDASYKDTAFDASGDALEGTYMYDRNKLLKYTEINESDWSITLKNTDSSGNQVTSKVLVDQDFWNGVGWDDSTVGDNSNTDPELIVSKSMVVFKNVGVKLTNQKEYVSIVTTDIVLAAPQLTFTQDGNTSNFYNYTLIADEGISTTNSAGQVNIEGSVFAGGIKTEEDVEKTGVKVFKKDESNLTRLRTKGGINVAQGTSLIFSNSANIISEADINLNGTGAGIRVSKPKDGNSTIFTNSINIDGGYIDLTGKVYAADDLNLDGCGPSAKITGEYLGYGNETNEDPDHSSAIIINGTKSTVDMRKVNRLLLAGRAYISGVTNNDIVDVDNQVRKMDTDTENPIIMGESIAVKGGQIAYMVPAEAIGIIDKNTHKTGIGMNPLNADGIKKLEDLTVKYGDDFVKVDIDKPIYSLKGKTLSNYIAKDDIREVNIQYASSNSDDKTMRYYYMVMSPESAKAYFKDYYSNINNKKAIDNYFKTYASGGILLGDYNDIENTEYTILGNALISSAVSESGVNLLNDIKTEPEAPDPDATPIPEDEIEIIKDESENMEDAMSLSDVPLVIGNLKTRYKNICSSLNESVEASDDTVVDYLAKTKEDEVLSLSDGEIKGLRDYLKSNGNSVEFKNGKYSAYFTNSDVTISSLPSDVRLVVVVNKNDDMAKDATDFVGSTVTVDKNFTGTILCEGKIEISQSVNIKQDKQGVFLALQGTKVGATEGAVDEGLKAIDFFTDSKTLINGAEDINTKLNWSDIVYYNNWYKK